MKYARAKFILTTLVAAQMLISCSGSSTGNSNSSQNSANQNQRPAASDKAEELSLLINLPIEPEETAWREEETGGSHVENSATSKKLTAVLKFAPADAGKVQAMAEKNGPPEAVSIGTETWFPAELVAQGDLSGDDTLKGNACPATDFYAPPYVEGKITRIEGTDYFVLELYAK